MIAGVFQPRVTVSGSAFSIGFQNLAGGATIAAVPTVAFDATNLTGGTILSSVNTTFAGTGGSVALTATSIVRNATGAAANFVAGSGGTQTLGGPTNQFLTLQAPATYLTNGTIKGGTVADQAAGNFNLLTANPSSSGGSLAAMTSYFQTVAAGGTVSAGSGIENVLIAGTPTVLGTSNLFGVLIRGDNSSLTGTSLTFQEVVTTGATATGDSLSVGTQTFGANEGMLLTNAGSTLNVTTALTGAGR